MIRIKLAMLVMCLAMPVLGRSFADPAHPVFTVAANTTAPKKGKAAKTTSKTIKKEKKANAAKATAKAKPKTTKAKNESVGGKKKVRKAEAKDSSKKSKTTKTLKAKAPKKQPKPAPRDEAFETEDMASTEEYSSPYDSGDDYTSLWLSLLIVVLLAGLGGYFYAVRKNLMTAKEFDFNESDVIGDAQRSALGERFSVADRVADQLRGEARPGDPDAEFAPLASDQVTLTKNHVRPTSTGLGGVFGKLKDVATGSGIGRRKAKEPASAHATEKPTRLPGDDEGVA